MVLAAERDARAGVAFQVRHVDEVLRFRVGHRHVVLGRPGWTRTPIERDGRVLHAGSGMAGIPSFMVQIVNVGELAVEKIIILIGEQGKRIAHGNVLRTHAGRVDELAQQSQDHLGRGVHVIQPAHQS